MGSCGRPFSSPDGCTREAKGEARSTSRGYCFGGGKGKLHRSHLEPLGRRSRRGKMRPPLLLLLALLALLATFARAEAPQDGTLKACFQDWMQKAQERISAFRTSNVAQQFRELVQTGISTTQEIYGHVKSHVSKLLEKRAANA
ncbi:apolipoprotein C-III [Liasis olivaceus]